MAADRDARIRERAHEIWEREGRQHGQHDRHWAQAVAEIDAEDARTKQGKAKDGDKRSLADAAVEAVTRIAGAALNAAAESVTGTGKRTSTKKPAAESTSAKATAPKRAASAAGAPTARKTSTTTTAAATTGRTAAGKSRTGSLDRTAAADKPAARGTKKGR